VSLDRELQAPIDGPVTTTVTRRVKPGHEAAYEAVLAEINHAAGRFRGYLGVEVQRPADAMTGEYRIVYRFDSPAHLQSWLDSDDRATALQRTEPHVAGPMKAAYLSGLETWFTLPSQPGPPTPSRHKMAMVTWAAIYPLITIVVIGSRPLVSGLPITVRLATTTLVTVPLMTWAVMPRLTWLLRGWLYPAERRPSASD
jgi:antibiotic biosynthesis monooxygenase (ABM) superfamily enzyme